MSFFEDKIEFYRKKIDEGKIDRWIAWGIRILGVLVMLAVLKGTKWLK